MSIIFSKKNKKYSLGKGVASTSNQSIRYDKGTYIDFNNNKVYLNPRYRVVNGDTGVYVKLASRCSVFTISTFSSVVDMKDVNISNGSFVSLRSLGSNGVGNRAVSIDTNFSYFNIVTSSSTTKEVGTTSPLAISLSFCASNGSDSGVLVYSFNSTKSIYLNLNSNYSAVVFSSSSDNTSRYRGAGLSNGRNQRAVFAGGRYGGTEYSTFMEYFTIGTRSNASVFGNLTESRRDEGAVSNDIYDTGLYIGGQYSVAASSNRDSIEKITISTTSNASIISNINSGGGFYSKIASSNGIGDISVIYGEYNSTYHHSKFTISTLSSSLDTTSINSQLTIHSLNSTSNGAV